MKWVLPVLVLIAVCRATADTLILQDDSMVQGRFMGFSNRQFMFKPDDGVTRAEYAIDVKGIVLAAPVKASLVFFRKSFEDVVFSGFDQNTLRFRKAGVPLTEPVVLLKRLEILTPAAPPRERPPAPAMEQDPAVTTRIVAPPKDPGVRDWKREGKWREIAQDKTGVISQGETVDIESCLKKGVVNVVHFHYPQAVGSVREGNYLQGIMNRNPNRLVVLKVVTRDFQTPICEALGLKSLPQFWFYNADGKLVKRLTDRFTEGDIDAAIREAGRR
jgi:hypothetical protein